VIVKGVDALPVEHRRKAETHLIGCAAEHDPVALRRLAHHVLEVVAPRSPKPTSSGPSNARKPSRGSLSVHHHRRRTRPVPRPVHPPSHVGAILKQAVLAINSPRHRHHSGTPKGLGHAFCEYVTRYPVDRLPRPAASTPPWWSR
jgi:hypothetical protein